MWNVAAIPVPAKPSFMNKPAAYGCLFAGGVESSYVLHPFCLGWAKESDNVNS
jgi:hypothetical protein